MTANHLPADDSRANSRNVVYIKCTPGNGQYAAQCLSYKQLLSICCSMTLPSFRRFWSAVSRVVQPAASNSYAGSRNSTMGVTPGCISYTITLLCPGTQTPEFVKLAKEDNGTALPFISWCGAVATEKLPVWNTV